MVRRVNLLGSHVRPFMENGHSFGYSVSAVDYFNDWDSARFGTLVGPSVHTGSSPRKTLECYALPEHAPTLFCGPVECWPEVLEEAERDIEVLNSPSRSVRRARDISLWKEAAGNGILMPETCFAHPGDGRDFIVKNIRSAGGCGINGYAGAPGEDEYLQEVIPGIPLGAMFLSSGGGCVLAGTALHITGEDCFGQRPFLYGGAVYPANPGEENMARLARFGQRVSDMACLTGWWGADFILVEGGLYLLEINPRLTASMELMAKARGVDLIGAQIAAARGETPSLRLAPRDRFLATAVCYAKEDMRFKGAENWFRAGCRDIPRDGWRVAKGEPMISLYAEGGSPESCMETLKRLAEKLYGNLGGE